MGGVTDGGVGGVTEDGAGDMTEDGVGVGAWARVALRGWARYDGFGAERVGAQGWAASGYLVHVKHERGQRRERAHLNFKTVIDLACPYPHLFTPLPMPSSVTPPPSNVPRACNTSFLPATCTGDAQTDRAGV